MSTGHPLPSLVPALTLSQSSRYNRDDRRDRDRDRDRHHNRDRVPREPRDHPPTPSKRNSITDRLLGSFRAARDKDTPLPPIASSVQRRVSTAATKGSPIPRIREWLDACNAGHNHHCAVSSDTDITTWHPAWLINVVDRRLVKATPKDRGNAYLAAAAARNVS